MAGGAMGPGLIGGAMGPGGLGGWNIAERFAAPPARQRSLQALPDPGLTHEKQAMQLRVASTWCEARRDPAFLERVHDFRMTIFALERSALLAPKRAGPAPWEET